MFDKTVYSILDEHGEKSTISLDKLVADVLQLNLPDVHAWVQNAYNRVAEKKPELGRKQQGNIVRALSNREAEKYPEYKEMIDSIFGI